MPRPLFLLPSVLLLTASLVSSQTVRSVLTTSDLKHALEPQADLHFAQPTAPVTGTRIIHVDETQRFQAMEGFGASITDGAAWLLEENCPLRLATLS